MMRSPAALIAVDRSAVVLKERRKLLEEFLATGFADLSPRANLRPEVQVGVPYKKIVERASAEGVDLIVMSTHGRAGLAHVLIGSVTEKVVQHASCPVLSIPRLKSRSNTSRPRFIRK